MLDQLIVAGLQPAHVYIIGVVGFILAGFAAVIVSELQEIDMSIEELREIGIVVNQPLPDVSDVWFEVDVDYREEL